MFSAFENQIASHHFSPFLRNINQKGEQEKINHILTHYLQLPLSGQSVPGKPVSDAQDKHLDQGQPRQTCLIKSQREQSSNQCSESVCPNSWG